MNNKLYHDELEGFLSESADELRMYPSDRVWRNINKEIQGECKWPALTFGAVLTGALMLAALIFLQPDKDLFAVKHSTPLGQIPVVTTHTFKAAGQPIAAHFEPAAQNDQQVLTLRARVVSTAEETITPSTETDVPSIPAATAEAFITQSGTTAVTDVSSEEQAYALTDYMHANTVTPGTSILFQNSLAYQLPTVLPMAFESAEVNGQATAPANAQLTRTKKSRWALQYYITPSMSYRFLSEETTAMANALSNTRNTLGAMVKHTPKTGIEAGVAISYQVTENLRVKMGLQANYRRYAIDAYNTAPQPAVIAVNQGFRLDTMIAMTDISNVSGGKPLEVSNELLQLSAPIGFELQMAKFKRASFVVAATIQPTYNIGQQSWLISSDYMSYVKQPSLLRKWNINTGIEAFMQFNGKKGITWQVGPQIRYQMLPGAVRSYPVREHLIDYGVKIGLIKSLR